MFPGRTSLRTTAKRNITATLSTRALQSETQMRTRKRCHGLQCLLGTEIFTVAYSWDNTGICGKYGDWDIAFENGAVEPLLNPFSLDPFLDDPYDSAAFNLDQQEDPSIFPYGDAGFVASSADPVNNHLSVSELMTTLSTAMGWTGLEFEISEAEGRRGWATRENRGRETIRLRSLRRDQGREGK